MFAPSVAKAQTKTAVSSTNTRAHPPMALIAPYLGQGAVEEAHMLPGSIGNQAMLRLLAQRAARLTEQEPGDQHASPADPTVDRLHAPDREAAPGVSGEVSHNLGVPRDRSNPQQTRPPLVAPPRQGAIQPKLVVGQIHDPLEHEADRIADQVLEAPAPSAVSGAPQQIQRVSGQPTGQPVAAPTSVDQALTGPGRSLEPALQQDMEQRFGYDFSQVRVHTGAAAEQSARDLNAHAYTVGHNIVFGTGQFAPGTHQGRRLIAHELTHVVQQSGADGIRVDSSNEKRGLSAISGLAAIQGAVGNVAIQHAPREEGGEDAPVHSESALNFLSVPVPRAMTQPQDQSEQQAATLASRNLGSPPPKLVKTRDPIIARYPKDGEEQQRRESEALAHGQSPYDLGPPTLDPFQQQLKELLRNPPPRQPAPTLPGSWIQEEEAVPEAEPSDLFSDPTIQARLEAIAQAAENRERAAGKVTDTVDALMARWKVRFVGSVAYILYKRSGDKRKAILKTLHAQERKLETVNPPDLSAQVEALRAKARTDWLEQVQRAVNGFVILAENDAQFLSVHQSATPVRVFGLPDTMEKTVDPADRPDVLETGKDAKPSAASVVRFMVAVQKESKIKAVAENYLDHEKANPWVGDPSKIGHYSFDVHLDGFVKLDANGFYDQGAVIDYFLAVDRAAKTTNIEWVAIYNDFTVAKIVNEKLGKLHIGFSGGGGFPPRFPMGSFHHGPAPYVLHIHFNIMPLDLKDQFDKLMSLKKAAQQVLLPFIEFFNPPK